MSAPSDIEMAQLKKVCAALANAVDGHLPEVVLPAVELFAATVVVMSDVDVELFTNGVREAVERIRARTA